ncbi:MAG: hypothetical protein WCE64_06015 [Bacteroidales bacterium]
MKTKKNLLILICILTVFISASAQLPTHYAGLKAGFGIPNLTSGSKTTPLSDDYESKAGFYAGLVTEYRTNHLLGLRVELNYSAQGGERWESDAGQISMWMPDHISPS